MFMAVKTFVSVGCVKDVLNW